MRRRHLDVTAYTTFDHLDACAEGGDWSEEAIAILDIESPQDEQTVSLGLELDPGDLDHLPHHVQYVQLTPAQARRLADELEDAAQAAENGNAMTSGRG